MTHPPVKEQTAPLNREERLSIIVRDYEECILSAAAALDEDSDWAVAWSDVIARARRAYTKARMTDPSP